MYNTKRLAGSARKAERDGRTFEANNLWGQVITRAESLVARHPDSKYVDEALVLKGVALVAAQPVRRRGRSARPRVAAARPTMDVTEEASLALGRCQLQLGDPGRGGESCSPGSPRARIRYVRSEARLLRAARSG